MKLIEMTREYQDLVNDFVDSGMTIKEAEILAHDIMVKALA